MWVGGVEIPRELVDAHRRGDLVLFVGAGASKDPPANLPDFDGLTRAIAGQALYDLEPGPVAHPDVVLGRIKDRNVDVHRLVADELSDPASTYNRLHEAIVDLGLSGPDLRIVTTNFDRHLTSALGARGATADEYAAPALPVGNDFTGIVYIHGTLSRPPRHLVVTDDDFGRAYLRDAWAARFLERMFGRFTVLFIGYSHADVVMRYLARALGPDGHRYVLTSNPGDQDWIDLGLRPIGYEVVGGSHAALGNAVAGWATNAAMGLLDHRGSVAGLVAAPPTGIPEDESYLEELIADPARVDLFTEFARGSEWLDWTFQQAVFKRLFTRGLEPAQTDWALARWFVEFFVMEEELTDKALSIATEGGGFIGPEVCNAIGGLLHARGAPRPDWLGPWVVLLLRDAPPSLTHWLDYAFVGSTWPNDREQTLLLFDLLTEPAVRLEPSFGFGGARLEIHLRGDEHWLEQGWEQLLRPNLAEVLYDVASIVDRHLRRVRQLQVGAQPQNPDWDSVSFGRSAIEPHPQDRYREPIDVLIDAARDVIELMFDRSDPAAVGYVASWAAAESQILRRLAVHGWAYRADVDATAKLEWVVRTGWFDDHRVHHEVFRLIALAIPDASDEAIGALVAQILKTAEGEEDFVAYERYNALVWMNRHRPDHPTIMSALAEAHAVNPEWAERENPDLTHSMEVGFAPSRPPMSVAEFHHALRENRGEALVALEAFKGAGPWDGGPTWEDALTLIRDSVQAEPGDGFEVLEIRSDDEVVRAVIEGWSRADLTADAAAKVVALVITLDLAAVVRDLARMLSSGGRMEGHPTDWTGFPGARHLALELWNAIPDDGAIDQQELDWLHRAINHPGGNLAEFWLHVVQRDWRANEEAWSGLTDEHRSALEMMLHGPPDRSRTQMAEVIIVSRLHFLFAADPSWTSANALPLLDWSDPDRARRCWNSFSAWGRWSDQLLDAGLMDLYLDAVRHISEIDGRDQRLLAHLAGIATTSVRDPLEWLPGVLVDLRDEDRVRLADDVAEILDDLPQAAVEHQWSRWINRYWGNRLNSLPTQLSIDECSAMAGWVPFLGAFFDAGLELALMQPGRFRDHDGVLRHLDGEGHVDRAPDACALLIGHLLRDTVAPWYGGWHLQQLWPRLRSGSRPEHLEVIVEQALRLGIGNPESW